MWRESGRGEGRGRDEDVEGGLCRLPAHSEEVDMGVGSRVSSCGRWGRILVLLVLRPLGRSTSFDSPPPPLQPLVHADGFGLALFTFWLATGISTSSLAGGIRQLSYVISDMTLKTFWPGNRIYTSGLLILELSFPPAGMLDSCHSRNFLFSGLEVPNHGLALNPRF